MERRGKSFLFCFILFIACFSPMAQASDLEVLQSSRSFYHYEQESSQLDYVLTPSKDVIYYLYVLMET